MAGFTNYWEVELLKATTGQTLAASLPITPGIVLWTTLPNEAGTGGVEVSGGGYSRKTGAGKFGAPVAGDPSSVSNNATLDWGTATAAWGTVVGASIVDNGTAGGGNILATATLPTGRPVAASDPVSFPAGTLIFQLD